MMKTRVFIPDTIHCCPNCSFGIASGLDEYGNPELCDDCERLRREDAFSAFEPEQSYRLARILIILALSTPAVAALILCLMTAFR